MNLLRFKQATQIVQNLRIALRLAEEKGLDDVASRLEEALAEAERAQKELRSTNIINGTNAKMQKEQQG